MLVYTGLYINPDNSKSPQLSRTILIILTLINTDMKSTTVIFPLKVRTNSLFFRFGIYFRYWIVPAAPLLFDIAEIKVQEFSISTV